MHAILPRPFPHRHNRHNKPRPKHRRCLPPLPNVSLDPRLPCLQKRPQPLHPRPPNVITTSSLSRRNRSSHVFCVHVLLHPPSLNHANSHRNLTRLEAPMENSCLLARLVTTFCPLSPSIQRWCGDLGLRMARKKRSMIVQGMPPSLPFFPMASYVLTRIDVSAILPSIISHGLAVYLLMGALPGKNPRPHPTPVSA